MNKNFTQKKKEALNESKFAQFLSENIDKNNTSESDISYLLNLFNRHSLNQAKLNSNHKNIINNEINSCIKSSINCRSNYSKPSNILDSSHLY